MSDIIEVSENIFGQVIAKYENGFMTTAGFCEKPLSVDNSQIAITYTSDHADCLPCDWPDRLWLDDNNKRQKIKEILWDREQGSVFRMQDGYISEGVTS